MPQQSWMSVAQTLNLNGLTTFGMVLYLCSQKMITPEQGAQHLLDRDLAEHEHEAAGEWLRQLFRDAPADAVLLERVASVFPPLLTDAEKQRRAEVNAAAAATT